MFSIFKKPRIGLALGGGGARGFFHIGVIQALQELNIEISEVSGTSIGAIIGTIYASNPQVDFNKIVNDLDFLKLMQDIILGLRGGITVGLEKYLQNYIPVKTFGQLAIPMSFNAVNINSRQEIIFNTGNIFPAIIASFSIPGVFPPINLEDNLLIDGGYLNNIPISLLPNSSKIIISDINGPFKTIDSKSTPLDIFSASIVLLQEKISQQNLADTKGKKIIHLSLGDDLTSILDFRKNNYQPLIDLGYQAMMAQKKEF